jgi:hypothetical protein
MSHSISSPIVNALYTQQAHEVNAIINPVLKMRTQRVHRNWVGSKDGRISKGRKVRREGKAEKGKKAKKTGRCVSCFLTQVRHPWLLSLASVRPRNS